MFRIRLSYPILCNSVILVRFLSFGISSCNIIPVDNVPDVLDVVRSGILVLEVVSVLPNIKAQQGNQAGGGQ